MSNVTVQEALKAAIEAMENEDDLKPIPFGIRCIRAINKCKAALSEMEKCEPFGYFKAEPFGWTDCAETDEGAIALYELPQPIEKCEPVLKVHHGEICYKSQADDQSYGMWCPVNFDTDHTFKEGAEFYTSPQPRDWVGLNSNDLRMIFFKLDSMDKYAIAEAIEAKLKQLNTSMEC